MVYRVTKNSHIPIPDRQGYYIEARNQLEAFQKAVTLLPDNKGLTFQVWN